MDILNRYRENRESSSSESDSENSDDECEVWKRATSKKTDENEHLQDTGMNEEPLILSNNEKDEVAQAQDLTEQPKPVQKRKKNTIWCDVLQDQLISEDLEDCLLKKPRNFGSRGKESYDYTRAYGHEEEDSDSEMSGCSLNDEPGADYIFKSKKKQFYHTKDKSKKFVKLDNAELEAARKINKIVQEKKYYLIQRIVKFAGIEKAMHYLELTKEIEENGGLLIKNQSRRRTPGGVYIQMLKDDKDTTKEILDKIFEGEMSGYEMKKFYDQKRKKKNKNKKKKSKGTSKQVMEVNMEPDEVSVMDAEVMQDEKPPDVSNIDIPPAPTNDTASVENASDLEEGEIED